MFILPLYKEASLTTHTHKLLLILYSGKQEAPSEFEDTFQPDKYIPGGGEAGLVRGVAWGSAKGQRGNLHLAPGPNIPNPCCIKSV